MEKVDTLVVDKTGTLTEGKPKVVAIVPAQGFDENTVLEFAASVERASEHPLGRGDRRGGGRAQYRAASRRAISMRRRAKACAARSRADASRSATGKFLAELGIAIDALEGEAERLRGDGATVVFVAVDGKLAGLIAIADPVKPTTPAALAGLKAQNIADRDADRRQSASPRAPSPKNSASTMSRPRSCPNTRAPSSKSCAAKAASSPWPATASTMRRRSPRPTSASPWATAPTSPWRAPA